MVIIEEGVSLAELDEALRHVAISLKTDKYGARMSHRKHELLLESIDSLLDERIELSRKLTSAL